MNELKPEDVIRALECCICGTSEACLSCQWKMAPYPACRTVVMRNALALLREKDKEIARLDAYASGLLNANEVLWDNGRAVSNSVIDEYVERVKRRLPMISPSVFDNIKKELKSGRNV